MVKNWVKKRLGEVADVKTGPFGSTLHASDYVSVGTPIITVEHLGENGVVHNNLPLVSQLDCHRLSAYMLRTGDIVFSRVGSVDRNAFISDAENTWLFSGRLLRIRVTCSEVDALYLSYYFKDFRTKNRIYEVAVGQTMASLNTKILNEFLVSFPSYPEQRAIAAALLGTDTYIAALEKLISKKRFVKQGAMQELLTGRRRLPGFSGKWVEKSLGDLLTYEQPQIYIVKDTRYFTSGTPVLTAGKSLILGYTTETNGVYDNLPVIIFDDFTTESKFIDFKFKVKSSAMKLLTSTDICDIRLTFAFMQMINFQLKDHQRYWISEYSKIYINIPSDKAEQTAIAEVLSNMDAEIDALTAKLDKAKRIKQGMMSDLLTGRIRLVETEPAITTVSTYVESEPETILKVAEQPAAKGYNALRRHQDESVAE